MRNSSPLFSILSNALLIFSSAVLWMLFAPVKLGGVASYAIINGRSMEPTFHAGDLIILTRRSNYKVGDIVAYQDPQMKANIIHRIIKYEGGHYFLKGDNNSWVDPFKPTEKEIFGTEYIFFHKAGNWILWLRKPINMSIFVGLLGGGIIMSMTFEPKSKKYKNKQQKSMATSIYEIPLYLLGFLSILFLVSMVYSFSRPSMKKANGIPYSESGFFAYSASGTPNTYDSGSAVSGEPLFLKLTCNLNLEYQFSLVSPNPENISGYYHLIAVVRDDRSGWQRTLQLTPDSSFNGITFTNQATLDICRIVSMVRSVEAETGVQTGSYGLDIISSVNVRGKLSGQQFIDTFEHPLAFKLDNTHLYMDNQSSNKDPFKKTDQEVLPNPVMVDNSISILQFHLLIKHIRLFSVVGLLLSSIGLLTIGYYYSTISKKDKAFFIKLKYGSMIIDASITGPESTKLIIDVKSIEELVSIALKQNVFIFHLHNENKHYYLMENEGTIYRYTFMN